MILMIDNFDSFVFNIYQYALVATDEEIKCLRNDEITADEVVSLAPSKIILSPGPKHPKDSGVCLEILEFAKAGKITAPILGVCLGHQAIALSFGADIKRLSEPRHGKTSMVEITAASPVFKGLPSEFEVMRYHSLYADNLPSELICTALSKDDNIIMALSHATLPIHGIQFHPESYFTTYGRGIIENFVHLKG